MHVKMGPAAVGAHVTHLRVRDAAVARDAFANAGVVGAIVGMLDELQQLHGNGRTRAVMSEREFGREMIELRVGIEAPGSDLAVEQELIAGRLIIVDFLAMTDDPG